MRGAGFSGRAKRCLVIAAIIAAALKSFVPFGYMPFFEGGRLSLITCNGYTPAPEEAAAAQSHHHQGAGEQGAPAPEGGGPNGHGGEHSLQPCTFAVAGHLAISVIAPEAVPPAVPAIIAAPVRETRLEGRALAMPRVRGPPLSA